MVQARPSMVEVHERKEVSGVACGCISGWEYHQHLQHFSYLGSYFSVNCSLDKEISWRFTAAGAAMQRAAKFWRSRDISTCTKTRIYGSLVLSVLLYRAESWPITPFQLQRLEVFHRQCLRSILGVHRCDGISMEDLLRRTQLCSVGTTIRRLRLRWCHQPAGPCHAHAWRACRTSRQVLLGQLRDTRPVGSPPVTLRGLMRMNVLLLDGGGGQVHGRAGINSAWRRLHGGLALSRCYDVFRSLHGLEIHCNGQGPTEGHAADRQK